MPYKDKNKDRECKQRWYQNHKSVYLERNIRIRGRKVEFLKEIRNIPCFDCKERYPYYVMEFDHRGEDAKFKDVTSLVNYGWGTLKKEIAKCDVVCANCHRARTHFRRIAQSANGRPDDSESSNLSSNLSSAAKLLVAE